MFTVPSSLRRIETPVARAMVLLGVRPDPRRYEHDDQGCRRQLIRPGRRTRPQESQKQVAISDQGERHDGGGSRGGEGRDRVYDDSELAVSE